MGRRAAASGSEDASGLERFSAGQLGRDHLNQCPEPDFPCLGTRERPLLFLIPQGASEGIAFVQ